MRCTGDTSHRIAREQRRGDGDTPRTRLGCNSSHTAHRGLRRTALHTISLCQGAVVRCAGDTSDCIAREQ